MQKPNSRCPDCEMENLQRREFLRIAGAGAVAAMAAPSLLLADPNPTVVSKPPETLVKTLFDSLSDNQKQTVCFAWDHQDPQRGLLRTRVANNWHVTQPSIDSRFFTDDQRDLIRAIFEGIIHPEWHAKIDKQLQDDAGGYGKEQNIAIFGQPGKDKFQFVMTGRHMTLRCDGDSADHVAFGGPIFYGHAAEGFNEKPDHPGNVFWEQALEANKVYEMLDGRQRALAEVARTPREQAVGFRGSDGPFPGNSTQRNDRGPERAGPEDLAETDRTVSPVRPGRSHRVPQEAGRTGRLLTGLLHRPRHRRRPGLGQLASGGSVLRLVLPRRATCPRLGQRRRQSSRRTKRLTLG
jgi:hypothetical protein